MKGALFQIGGKDMSKKKPPLCLLPANCPVLSDSVV